MIVDDHQMIRDVYKALLKELNDFETVADTGDARTVLSLCAAYQPDVVLMDLLMPNMNGVAATQLIRDNFPHIEVVVLSASISEPLVDDALKAGAISYILKNGTVEELVHSLRSAYAGKSILASEVIDIMVTAIQKPAGSQRIGSDLTEREREVLALMVFGLTNRQLAERLFISPSTVKYHISRIATKLGTPNRTKIIALALQHNLVTKD